MCFNANTACSKRRALTRFVNVLWCFHLSQLLFIVTKDRAAGCLCPMNKLKHLI